MGPRFDVAGNVVLFAADDGSHADLRASAAPPWIRCHRVSVRGCAGAVG
jgi:hypothetical protein